MSPRVEQLWATSPRPERPERAVSPRPERAAAPRQLQTTSPRPERTMSPRPGRALSPAATNTVIPAWAAPLTYWTTSTGTPQPSGSQSRHATSPAPSSRSPSITHVPAAFAACTPTAALTDLDPEQYAKGVEVTIGAYHFRCSHVLGRGSFAEVWSGEIVAGRDQSECKQEVALKDLAGTSKKDLDQALFEVNLLSRLQGPGMCMPRYLAHRVDPKADGGSRIRIAMTRVPGEPLDEWLERPQPAGQDGPSAVHRGCMLATQLIKQLGPTLERVSRVAYHRDVNARNVLISDSVSGGLLDLENGSVENARFWLIDFGLAVEASTWPTAWQTSAIGGDCRYWPVSSWMMSFYGAPAVSKHKDLVRQYETRLDSYALGVMALELLCTPALASCDVTKTGKEDELRGSWRRLLTAWTKFRRDVTRWHEDIFKVFASGADNGPLFQRMSQERVVEQVGNHVAGIRACLRACIERTNDPVVKRLIWVIAELVDEGSSLSLHDAVASVTGERLTAPPSCVEPPATLQWSPPQPEFATSSPSPQRQRLSPQAPTWASPTPMAPFVAQGSPREAKLGEQRSKSGSQPQLFGQSPVLPKCGGA